MAVSAAAMCPLPAIAQGEPLSPRFAIHGFDVTGNSVLPPEAIERTLAALSGPDRSFADIQQAVELLESSYHSATT